MNLSIVSTPRGLVRPLRLLADDMQWLVGFVGWVKGVGSRVKLRIVAYPQAPQNIYWVLGWLFGVVIALCIVSAHPLHLWTSRSSCWVVFWKEFQRSSFCLDCCSNWFCNHWIVGMQLLGNPYFTKEPRESQHLAPDGGGCPAHPISQYLWLLNTSPGATNNGYAWLHP